MNKVRPYIPVLIVDGKVPSLKPLTDKQEYIIALKLDAAGDANSLRNIQRLIKGNTPFFVLVEIDCQADTDKTVETFELIELCLFSKNYFRISNIPVIAFDRTDGGSVTGTWDTALPANRLVPEGLIPHLQQQGWPAIHQWLLPSGLSFQEQIRGKKTPPLLVDTVDFEESFLRDNFFPNPSYLGDYIFFRNSGKFTAERIEQEFYRLCLSTIGNNQLWEVSFREYLSVKNSFSELSKKNNMLQEMLNNAETTISLIKDSYKKDYHRLFKWYHKEYEVLPLWYKRFGHLIKVFMGQRSFKSLFNGSERKYAK
ncbi:MAG TPA: hypothetical protein VL832_00955 [Puia sp.]|nr:hypothetical protein [Puia sp.]